MNLQQLGIGADNAGGPKQARENSHNIRRLDVKIPRDSWGAMPGVLIIADPSVVQTHPSYKDAKSGSGEAAAILVADILDEAAVDRVRQLIGSAAPTLVSAHAEEELGRNAIPQAAAAWLGQCPGFAGR